MTHSNGRLAGITTLAVAAVFAFLALSACGGGGGGGDTGTAPSVTLTRAEAQSANPSVVRNAGALVAGNLPNFGSVTQSANVGDVAGVSGDAASASFNGRDTRVTVRRVDGSQLALDTATHRIGRVPYDPVLPGYSYRGDLLLTYTGSSATLAAVYTNWNNVDPTDYLAGGYWLHLNGRTNPLMITGAEAGSFVDGPEISGSPTLPRLGTATYQGDAGGLYVYQSSRESEVGEFTGDMRLTANFVSNTISGCMGCRKLSVSGGHTDHATGRLTAFSGVSVPARLRLGATPIASDGTFAGRNVTFERDDVAVTSSSGSWGGRFSNIPTGTGDPRLAAGTGAAEWTDVNGGQGAAVGAWFGVLN